MQKTLIRGVCAFQGGGAGPNIALDMPYVVEDGEHLIDFAFPPTLLQELDSCLKRSILAPTNE